MAKVLVVDDDQSLRLLYQKELEDDGHQVTTVPSGKDALETISRARPDVVVLDIKMEEMDGLSVLDEIMKIDKTIPVILNTAYSTFKSDITTWSAEAYVVKSSDLSELKRTIAEVTASA
jgi:DNA-binding NtrC family response regulator